MIDHEFQKKFLEFLAEDPSDFWIPSFIGKSDWEANAGDLEKRGLITAKYAPVPKIGLPQPGERGKIQGWKITEAGLAFLQS